MKKIGVIVLVFMFLFIVAGTAFAIGMFADVPTGSWVYDALTQLQKAGIIEGYTDGAFKGDKVLSRYEVAIIVGRAVENSVKANAEQKELITKLQKEFSNELAKIDATLMTGEAKQDTLNDKLNLSGYLSARYRNVTQNGDTDFGQGMQRLYLWIMGDLKVNDAWSGHIISKSYYFWGRETEVKGATNAATSLTSAWLTGKVGDVEISMGSIGVYLGDCMALGEGMNGIRFDFGKNIKTAVFYGQFADTGYFRSGNDPAKTSADGYGISFNKDITKSTNVNLLFGGNSETFEGQSRAAELAVHQKLGQNLLIRGAYARTDADEYNYNYRYGLQYKQMDFHVRGSYDILLEFAKYQRNGSMNGSCADDNWSLYAAPDSTDKGNYTYLHGYAIGFDYAIQKNIDLQTRYYCQKLGKLATATDPNEADRNGFRVFVNYHF